MPVERDQFDQVQDWDELTYDLLAILEEVSSAENPDRTLAAYVADILDAIEANH